MVQTSKRTTSKTLVPCLGEVNPLKKKIDRTGGQLHAPGITSLAILNKRNAG